MEKGLPPAGVPVPVQFEATVYVPMRDSVAITPSWDAVVSPVNMPVVESDVAPIDSLYVRRYYSYRLPIGELLELETNNPTARDAGLTHP